MSNPIKDIPYEELKEYCRELGYHLSKKPEGLIPLELCPVCGRKPSYHGFVDCIRYMCPNDCLLVNPVYIRTMKNDKLITRTKHETNQLARRAWNDAVEGWKERNEKCRVKI